MLGLRDLVLVAPNPSSSSSSSSSSLLQPITTNDPPSALPLHSSASLGVGLGIFPLHLTASPCFPHPQTNAIDQNPAYRNLNICPEFYSSKRTNMAIGGEDYARQVVGNEGFGVGTGDLRVCKECGNRGDKSLTTYYGGGGCRNCSYKGTGYGCSTQVKSNWVPGSSRPDRTVTVAVSGTGASSGSSSGAKRLKVMNSSQNATPSHISTSNASFSKRFDINSYHQDVGFRQSLPVQVRAPAVFRCHRVTAMGNGENEIAYLATVHISGHVFKGFLYDKGVDEKNALPCISPGQLESESSGRNRDTSSSPAVVPPNTYKEAYN